MISNKFNPKIGTKKHIIFVVDDKSFMYTFYMGKGIGENVNLPLNIRRMGLNLMKITYKLMKDLNELARNNHIVNIKGENK
jgi:hypothetical protein